MNRNSRRKWKVFKLGKGDLVIIAVMAILLLLWTATLYNCQINPDECKDLFANSSESIESLDQEIQLSNRQQKLLDRSEEAYTKEKASELPNTFMGEDIYTQLEPAYSYVIEENDPIWLNDPTGDTITALDKNDPDYSTSATHQYLIYDTDNDDWMEFICYYNIPNIFIHEGVISWHVWWRNYDDAGSQYTGNWQSSWDFPVTSATSTEINARLAYFRESTNYGLFYFDVQNPVNGDWSQRHYQRDYLQNGIREVKTVLYYLRYIPDEIWQSSRMECFYDEYGTLTGRVHISNPFPLADADVWSSYCWNYTGNSANDYDKVTITDGGDVQVVSVKEIGVGDFYVSYVFYGKTYDQYQTDYIHTVGEPLTFDLGIEYDFTNPNYWIDHPTYPSNYWNATRIATNHYYSPPTSLEFYSSTLTDDYAMLNVELPDGNYFFSTTYYRDESASGDPVYLYYYNEGWQTTGLIGTGGWGYIALTWYPYFWNIEINGSDGGKNIYIKADVDGSFYFDSFTFYKLTPKFNQTSDVQTHDFTIDYKLIDSYNNQLFPYSNYTLTLYNETSSLQSTNLWSNGEGSIEFSYSGKLFNKDNYTLKITLEDVNNSEWLYLDVSILKGTITPIDYGNYLILSSDIPLMYKVWTDGTVLGFYDENDLIPKSTAVGAHNLTYQPFANHKAGSILGIYESNNSVIYSYSISEDPFSVSVENFYLSDFYSNLYITATKNGAYSIYENDSLIGSGNFIKEGTLLNAPRNLTTGTLIKLSYRFVNSSDIRWFNTTYSNADTSEDLRIQVLDFYDLSVNKILIIAVTNYGNSTVDVYDHTKGYYMATNTSEGSIELTKNDTLGEHLIEVKIFNVGTVIAENFTYWFKGKVQFYLTANETRINEGGYLELTIYANFTTGEIWYGNIQVAHTTALLNSSGIAVLELTRIAGLFTFKVTGIVTNDSIVLSWTSEEIQVEWIDFDPILTYGSLYLKSGDNFTSQITGDYIHTKWYQINGTDYAYTQNIDTTGWVQGNHNITFFANSTWSQLWYESVIAVIDDVVPLFHNLNYENGSWITNQVTTFEVNATDNNAVYKIKYKWDNGSFWLETTLNYFSSDLSLLSWENHSLTIRVYDEAGNYNQSTYIFLIGDYTDLEYHLYDINGNEIFLYGERGFIVLLDGSEATRAFIGNHTLSVWIFDYLAFRSNITVYKNVPIPIYLEMDLKRLIVTQSGTAVSGAQIYIRNYNTTFYADGGGISQVYLPINKTFRFIVTGGGLTDSFSYKILQLKEDYTFNLVEEPENIFQMFFRFVDDLISDPISTLAGREALLGAVLTLASIAGIFASIFAIWTYWQRRKKGY